MGSSGKAKETFNNSSANNNVFKFISVLIFLYFQSREAFLLKNGIVHVQVQENEATGRGDLGQGQDLNRLTLLEDPTLVLRKRRRKVDGSPPE